MTTHYEVLGVAPEATPAEIKAAYRRLAAENHPDRKQGDKEKMTDINRAYMILRDPEKRTRYDRTGQDDRQDSIEHEAIELITDGFAAYLESGEESDPLEQMRDATRASIEKLCDSIERDKQRLARIARKVKFVRRKKAGRDLFAQTVQYKKKNIQGEIESAERFLKVLDMALAMLDDYECDGPSYRQPPSPFGIPPHLIDAALQGLMNNRGFKK